jgi:hypothetical protein
MKNPSADQGHPEVTDMEHICDITPNSPETREICNKVNKHKDTKHKIKTNKKPKKI